MQLLLHISGLVRGREIIKMKKITFTITFIFVLLSNSWAHGGGFLERCDKIALPDCSFNWFGITTTDDALYLVGENGYCWISYHIGGTKTIKLATSDTLTGIKFITNSIGYCWGKNGILFKTADIGLHWTAINTNTTQDISKVQFIDENNGFIMSDTIVYKTTNGGASWSLLTLPTSISFKDFHFFDSQNGQICGQQTTPSITGFLYKTTDGGDSWTQLYSDTCAFTKLHYINNNKGYLYGKTSVNLSSPNALLLETNTTGNNWATSYSNTTWTLGSDVVWFNNQPTFISIESNGMFLHGCPYFLDPLYGIVTASTNITINIYAATVNNIETLFIISKFGLYQYTLSETLCKQINFASGVTPNSTNPYNIIATGKKVRFKALLTNNSSDTLVKADGKLRCNSPYITITDSIASYNNVLPNTGTTNSTWSVDEYEIELSASIPNDYIARFEFVYENKIPAGNTDHSSFRVPFVISPLSVVNNTIFDTSTVNTLGNGNGIVEPSETAQISPVLKNMSGDYLYGVKGYIYSPFTQIHIWNNVAQPDGSGVVYNNYSYNTFNPGDTAYPTGNFVFTDNFLVNYKIPFTLVLKGTISYLIDSIGCAYSDFGNIYYNWGTDFYINNDFSDPPDSLLANIPIDSVPAKISSYLFPNPNNGVFSLIINDRTASKNTIIEIRNLKGERVYYHNVQGSIVKINISDQPSGIYFLTIASTQSKQNIKIIKQ